MCYNEHADKNKHAPLLCCWDVEGWASMVEVTMTSFSGNFSGWGWEHWESMSSSRPSSEYERQKQAGNPRYLWMVQTFRFACSLHLSYLAAKSPFTSKQEQPLLVDVLSITHKIPKDLLGLSWSLAMNKNDFRYCLSLTLCTSWD